MLVLSISYASIRVFVKTLQVETNVHRNHIFLQNIFTTDSTLSQFVKHFKQNKST